MPARTLTVAAVERIKPPAEGQEDYFDRGFPGLALRVSYGGAKTWVYFYRLHDRKLRRMTLGRAAAMSLSEARDAWRDARKTVDQGESPRSRKPTVADSFAAVCEQWLKRDQAENKTAAAVKQIMQNHVNPVFDGRLIASIRRDEVAALLDSIADTGAAIIANRVYSYLHRLFRWAVGRGIIEINPMAHLPKPGKEVQRKRVLTAAELAAIWKAATKNGQPFGPFVQLLILTAGRLREIGELRWSEIDGDEIKLEGARTKNGEAHNIPLSAAAAELIATLPHIGPGDYVFTTTGETPISGWSRAKLLLDRTVAEMNGGNALAGWHFHDFRRTIATNLQRIGISLQVIEAILGHISGSRAGIVGVYQQHSFDTEKRIALEAWAQEVERIVTGKKAAVLPMVRPKRG